jgi:hypothetical protein
MEASQTLEHLPQGLQFLANVTQRSLLATFALLVIALRFVLNA